MRAQATLAIRVKPRALPLLKTLPRNEWIEGSVQVVSGRHFFVPSEPLWQHERIQLQTLRQLWDACEADIALSPPWDECCITRFESLQVPT